QPRLILVLGASCSAAFSLASVLFLRQRKTSAATVSVAAAFLLTGLSLGITDAIASRQNRFSRFYEQGIIAPQDPIDISATVDGPSERAPDRIFLRVRADKIRFKQTEYDCSGIVLLTAHVAEEERKRAFDALELRHGARIRVMVVLDREDTFRNPGVMPFTEY